MKSIQQILIGMVHSQELADKEREVKDQLGKLIADIYSSGIFYADAVKHFKKEYITHALRSNNGNKFRTAIELGMHRNTLDRTIVELKLDQRDWDPRLQLRAKPVQPAALAASAGARQA